jgi:hypothetical protein
VTGRWPDPEVDHDNQIKTDNRWSNLKEVTPLINNKNKPLSSTNVSGRTGVTFDRLRGQWYVQIKISGRVVFLGRFNKFEDACAAREVAEKDYGFHVNHGR